MMVQGLRDKYDRLQDMFDSFLWNILYRKHDIDPRSLVSNIEFKMDGDFGNYVVEILFPHQKALEIFDTYFETYRWLFPDDLDKLYYFDSNRGIFFYISDYIVE